MQELTLFSPYVKKRKWWDIFTPAYTLPQETDQDQSRIREFTGHVLEWCSQYNLARFDITESGAFSVIPRLSENTMAFANIIMTKNFRRLVYKADLDDFIQLIADNPSYTHATDIQQFLIELISSHEQYTIELILNKTYRAYNVFPIPDADYTWEDVHQMYPFLWVILFIQLTIRRYSVTAV